MSSDRVPKIPFTQTISCYCTTIEDGIRVNGNFPSGNLPNLLSSIRSVGDILKESATIAADRPCLGSHTSPTEPYTWITYAEFYARLKHFGSGLQEFDCLSATPWRCVGIYGTNCSEWVIAQYACASYRLTSVPLYDTLGDEAILHIRNQADLSTVVCDTPARASKLLALTSSLECLKHIIVMKSSSEEMKSLKSKAGPGVQIHTFDKIITLGSAHPKEVLVCHCQGLPKGVMILNKMIIASLNNNMVGIGPNVFEGYGCTETAGSMSISMASDLEGGHVGAPVPGVQLKLVDVPDMDIVVSRDKKGEICVRGPSCTPGYYKDPEKTAELFDSEGWMHTGDVGLWTEKNSLRIVDRCKHIFKLSQGEYIAPEKVETVYQGSPLISQVFVDGDAQQAFPVAIVVPELENLVERLNRKSKMANGHRQQPNGTVSASGEPQEHFMVMGKPMTAEQICKMEAAVNAVLEDMTELGKARGLKGFEQVRAIMLSPKAFSVENRMLTPTMKSAREVIRNEFASAIKALYCSSSIA